MTDSLDDRVGSTLGGQKPTAVPSESFTLGSPGSEIVGERWGTSPQAVVLLHAGVGDRRSWSAVAEHLSDAVSIVAYDRRGYGESPPAQAASSNVQDLLAVLDHLGLASAWLVGSSRGGALALETALVAPARVRGLVLLAPAVPGAPEPELDADTRRLGDMLDVATASGNLAEANRLHAWLWLDGPGQLEGRVAGAPRDLFLAMNAIVLANDSGEVDDEGTDVWQRLNEITVPVTVACGDMDVPFIVRRSAELAQLLPDARHLALMGMAHLPYLERSTAIAALINDALLP